MPPTRNSSVATATASRVKSPRLSPRKRAATTAAATTTNTKQQLVGAPGESVRIASGDEINGLALGTAGSDQESLPNLPFIGRRASDEHRQLNHLPETVPVHPGSESSTLDPFFPLYYSSSLSGAFGGSGSHDGSPTFQDQSFEAHTTLLQEHQDEQQRQQQQNKSEPQSQQVSSTGSTFISLATSPSFHSNAGLSPSETLSATSDSSPANSIVPLPGASKGSNNAGSQILSNQQSQQSHHSHASQAQQQQGPKFVSPSSMIAPHQESTVFQVPYGTLQLASQEQQNLFGGAPTSALGLQGISGDEMEGEDDEEGDEEEEEEDAGRDELEEEEEGKTAKGKGKATNANKGKRARSTSAPKAKVNVKGDQDAKTGRRKINISFIEDDARRHITFSKRKAGIMKKAYELATLTGTQVLLLVVSSTGLVYTFSTPKLKPIVRDQEGRELIQNCLNAPDPPNSSSVPASSMPDDERSELHKRAASSSQLVRESRAEYMESSRTPTLDSRVPSPDATKPTSPKIRAKRRRTITISAPERGGEASSATMQGSGSDQGGRLVAPGAALGPESRRGSLQPRAQPSANNNAPSAMFSDPVNNDSILANLSRMQQQQQQQRHPNMGHVTQMPANMPNIAGLPHSPVMGPGDPQPFANAWIGGANMPNAGTQGHHFMPNTKQNPFWQVGHQPGEINTSAGNQQQQVWER